MYLSSIYARIICTIVKVFSRILCWDSQKIMSHWDCLRCQISQFWTFGRQISFTLKCFNFGPKYKKKKKPVLVKTKAYFKKHYISN